MALKYLLFKVIIVSSIILFGCTSIQYPSHVAVSDYQYMKLSRGVTFHNLFASTKNQAYESQSKRRSRMQVLDTLVSNFQPRGLTCVRLTVDPYLVFKNGCFSNFDSVSALGKESEQLHFFNKDVLDDILQSIKICTSRNVCVDLVFYTEHKQNANKIDIKDQLYKNPRFVHTFGKLWSVFAKQISNTYTSEQVMFEIINEPNFRGAFFNENISKDSIAKTVKINLWNIGQLPTARMWLFTQEVLISYIRTAAPEFTIIASIDDNSHLNALPFSDRSLDKNVVYAIHFYEPDIFTHQSATFHPYAKYIKNLHYPYDSTNVAEVIKDVPVDLNWILTGYRGYSKETILSSIAKAKNWADNHNIRIWIGEAGVYAQSAPRTCVGQYYQDLFEAASKNKIGVALWDYDDPLFCNAFNQPGLENFWYNK